MKTNEPESLESLIEEMQAHSNRKDFPDEYLIENNHTLPRIGEFLYGVSSTPTAWVLPYLLELKKYKEKHGELKE